MLKIQCVTRRNRVASRQYRTEVEQYGACCDGWTKHDCSSTITWLCYNLWFLFVSSNGISNYTVFSPIVKNNIHLVFVVHCIRMRMLNQNIFRLSLILSQFVISYVYVIFLIIPQIFGCIFIYKYIYTYTYPTAGSFYAMDLGAMNLRILVY